MNNKHLNIINKVSLVLFGIAAILAIYNAVLQLQGGSYDRVYGYYAAGAAFAFVAATLYLRPKLGLKLFTVLVWGTAAYLIYTALLSLLALGNPFFILGVLFNPLRFINYGAQVAFVICLFLYLRSVRRIFKTLKFSVDGSLDARQIIPEVLQKRARKWLMVSLAALIIVAISFVPGAAKIFVNKVDPSGGNSHKMEQYLEKKYSEKFTLSKFKTNKQWRSSFESSLELKAEASPVKNPDIRFEVRGCIENCEPNDTFNDRYVYEYWAYEQKPVVEKKLLEVFGTIPEYEIEIHFDYRVVEQFSGTPPPFETIRSNPAYKPSISLSTYMPGVFTLENVHQAEAKTRVMTEYMSSLGVVNFSFGYVMKDPNPPTDETYKGGIDIKRSDIHCFESLGIDEKEIGKMRLAQNLSEFYNKWCSYETESGSGGGVARGKYPLE